MMSAAVRLHPHKAGDVWPGLSSVVIKVDGVPLDLTGTVVEMHFKRYVGDALPALALGSEGEGIVVREDATAGTFSVPARVVGLRPGRYFWELQVRTGVERVTYAGGTWEIMPEVVL
ncbi:hypothetical protein [Prosthecobacter algae]